MCVCIRNCQPPQTSLKRSCLGLDVEVWGHAHNATDMHTAAQIAWLVGAPLTALGFGSCSCLWVRLAWLVGASLTGSGFGSAVGQLPVGPIRSTRVSPLTGSELLLWRVCADV